MPGTESSLRRITVTARRALGSSTALLSTLAAIACGPPAPPETAAHARHPDVRFASGRPPVVVLGREGDPSAVVALAVTTAGVGWNGADDDPEPATALAGLVEARLKARSIEAVVVPAWDGLRASTPVRSPAEGARVAAAMRDALLAPVGNDELATARKKLAALGQRPLRDRSLGRYARCVGEPWGIPERTKDYETLDAARLERWREGAFGLGHVALAATGRAVVGEAVASAILQGPAWSVGAPIGMRSEPAGTVVDAYEGEAASASPAVFVTLDVGPSGAAVAAAEALGDPKGPLSARLSELDPPFRVREVTGAAHARGGCAGVVLEATTPSTTSSSVADAAALVRLEAAARLIELGEAAMDGRSVARRSGDAREAAERAAWWALADQGAAPKPAGGSVTLVLPSKRGTKEDASAVLRDSLTAAVTKAIAAWTQPVVEARSRVEAGQGEAWVLVGSPCGAEGETDADAGLSAIFASAAADMASAARGAADVAIEPWVAVDGVGLLAHGPPRPGESPAALARRLADVVTRALAAEPLDGRALGRARADLLRRDAQDDGPVISLLAAELAPNHSSWIDPWGSSEPIARSSDAAVLARVQSLRAGPLRVAVLANADASQADAAVHAADRWVARHGGEPRVCRAPSASPPPRPGTYAAPLRPGAAPEAYLAFPFPANDDVARAAAALIVASLDGDDVLSRALGLGTQAPLAREASARILGWPRAPAVVVRVVAPQAALDGAVMQVRALLDQVRRAGLAQPEYERAAAAQQRAALTTALDPRARVVATWRGDGLDEAAQRRATPEEVRAFAGKHLAEDAMVIVAARPPRPPAEAARP